MMDPKILSAIRAVILAAITTLSFFGLGHLVPFLEHALDQIPVMYELIVGLIATVVSFFPYLKKTDEQVKGEMVRKQYEAQAIAQSTERRKGFFNYTS